MCAYLCNLKPVALYHLEQNIHMITAFCSFRGCMYPRMNIVNSNLYSLKHLTLLPFQK
jgi:hypothetical protein